MDLAHIAQKGDNLETLRALRQRLAEAIDNTNSGRDLAPLSRQLQIVMAKIDELEAAEKDDDPIAAIIREQNVDEEAFRRACAENDSDEEIFDDF